MQNFENKSTGYQLKKQAVFDVLYKNCERNKQEQVSLASVLQYISKELGSNFKSSENIITELTQKLKARCEDGWILFADVCEILSGWMDKISLTPHCAMQETTVATEYTLQKTKCENPLPLPSPTSRKTSIKSGVIADPSGELLFMKCEKCGRDENCCEWRNNEVNREERITRCYEQKVTELQNLLRQSEDCNSVIQFENESLRRNNILLQNKEQRWITKEEELAEREQQLSSANTFLKEQNDILEKEILSLKQQLSRMKVENEKMASENLLLEAKVAERSEIEKHLCEAKLQQSQMEMDLDSKEILLAELETKLEQLQEYNHVLEAQISELQKSNSPATSHEKLHEQSLGEELMKADLSSESPLESNDVGALDILAESSLRAELDACGHWPLVSEHVAVQATPDTISLATQTDEKWLASEVSNNSKSKNLCGVENAYVHHNETWDGREYVDIMNGSMEINAEKCEHSVFPQQNSDLSLEIASSQISEASTSNLSITKNETCLYVPFVEPNGKVQANRRYETSYEMEVFIMVDALTQTEPFHQETINEDVKLFSTYKLDSEKQSIPVNSSMFLITKPCANCGCSGPSRNRIGSISQSSARESKELETVKNQEEDSKVVSHKSPQLFNLSLKNAISMQILCKKQYGNCGSVTKLFCCNRAAIYQARSVCWNSIMQHKKQDGSRFQCRIVQILLVMLAWYLFQTLTQYFNGHIQCNIPSFWSELHRVLAQKMELRWPRGPPPQ